MIADDDFIITYNSVLKKNLKWLLHIKKTHFCYHLDTFAVFKR